MMKKKQKFIKPEILRELSLLGDGSILAGSVVDNAVVVSAGQDLEEINAASPDNDWNHQWEW